MKSLILSLTIFASIIATTVFGAFFTDEKLKQFELQINAAIPQDTEETEVIYAGAKKIESEYENIEKYLILFIHDNDIREIEEHVSDIKSAALAGEYADAIAAKNRLSLRIEQLRRLSKLCPEAIF